MGQTELFLAAYLLDIAIGDPKWLLHPVRGMGVLITFLESPFYLFFANKRVGGALFMLTIVIISGGLAWTGILFASKVSIVLEQVLTLLLAYTVLAVGSLRDHANSVSSALSQGDIPSARLKLSLLVGRDTENLDEREIVRGTVESIGENTVDGILSPLFYLFIGGVPIAIAFKAVSTLDSMVGYRTGKYKEFGWASARLDDCLNYIPARLAMVFVPLGGFLSGFNSVRSVKIALRDGAKHDSPNSGIAESLFAGLLGIQLGGASSYNGVRRERESIGDKVTEICASHILYSNTISFVTSGVAVCFGSLLRKVIAG